MKRYILTVLIVLFIETGVLFGISYFFKTDLMATMFFGSAFFVLFSFVTSSNGDIFTKASQSAVFHATGGSNIPENEKLSLRIGPFFVGSLLCLGVYFGLEYLI